MTVKIRTASGASGINSIRVKGATATRRAARIKFRTGLGVGDLDQIFTGTSPIAVSFSPDPPAYFSINDSVVLGTVTATPSGGLAPFIYAWTCTAFSGFSPPSITSPTSATTDLVQSDVNPSDTATATLQVVVTDSVGQTSTTSVEASFTNISFS